MEKKKIIVMIPIKLKNERLPGKNTKLLGDKPLVSYIQETLLQMPELDGIFVYCSQEEVKPYLLDGVTFMKRPFDLDGPATNFSQIFQNFHDQVKADIYVYAHATAPFVSVNTIRRCIHCVTEEGYDSSFTAEKIQDFFWKDKQPLNFDAANVPRSQDIPPIYRETSGIYVYTNEVFETLHQRIGRNPYPLEVGVKEAIDINYPKDFQLAELMLNYQEVN